MLDFFQHFLRNRTGHQRKMISIIAISFLVLIIGGLILFFTKNNASPKEVGAVKLACHDSDRENLHTKGAITYTDTKGKHVDEDYCDPTDKAVYEMTCHKTSFWGSVSVPEKKAMVCPKGCINGACQK